MLNESLHLHMRDYHAGFRTMSKVVFECEAGYQTAQSLADRTFTCQADSTWDKSLSSLAMCEAVACDGPVSRSARGWKVDYRMYHKEPPSLTTTDLKAYCPVGVNFDDTSVNSFDAYCGDNG